MHKKNTNMQWPVLRRYEGDKLARVSMPLCGIGGCGRLRVFEGGFGSPEANPLYSMISERVANFYSRMVLLVFCMCCFILNITNAAAETISAGNAAADIAANSPEMNIQER